MKTVITIIVLSAVILLMLLILINVIKSNIKLKGDIKSLKDDISKVRNAYIENEKIKSKLHTGDNKTDFDNSISILQNITKARNSSMDWIS